MYVHSIILPCYRLECFTQENGLCSFAGKFKGNRDTGVLETKDLRELLEMSDHHKVVSSEGLLIKDQDLMALLDRSDLVSNAALQRKSGRPKKGQEHNGLFRVLGTDIPASQ